MSEVKPHSGADEKALQARANFERVLGEVLLFLSGVPPYDELFLEQLPARIIRPLVLKQFKITRNEEGLIIGYMSWALVTDELAAQLEAGEMVELDKNDWNCGERKVVVDKAGAVQC